MDHAVEDIIRLIVERTRETLCSNENLDQPQSWATPTIDLCEKFRGLCGLAQCIAGYALQDAGTDVKPLATQSLTNYWHGHAALTVQTNDGGIERSFLIDPTFCQFLAPSEGEGPSPVSRLHETAEGTRIAESLLENGYIELNENVAALYISSFCKGVCPLSIRDAFNFANNPPAHPYHFRRDEGCDDFSRDNLAGWGLLIRPAQIV